MFWKKKTPKEPPIDLSLYHRQTSDNDVSSFLERIKDNPHFRQPFRWSFQPVGNRQQLIILWEKNPSLPEASFSHEEKVQQCLKLLSLYDSLIPRHQSLLTGSDLYLSESGEFSLDPTVAIAINDVGSSGKAMTWGNRPADFWRTIAGCSELEEWGWSHVYKPFWIAYQVYNLLEDAPPYDLYDEKLSPVINPWQFEISKKGGEPQRFRPYRQAQKVSRDLASVPPILATHRADRPGPLPKKQI